MNVTRKIRPRASIPTTSTGDISFLLIVFFMSTTKFDVKEGVKVQLNKAVPEEQVRTTEIQLTEAEMTRLEILPDGRIKVNNEEPRVFTDEELVNLIQSKIEMRERLNQQSSDPEVRKTKMLFLVKTDSEAKYSDMVRVVDHLVSFRDRAMISISTQL